jgi:hypothetical protein
MKLTNYPFLQQLLDKHRLALQNNSKEIRITIRELNDIVMDVVGLIASVERKQENYDELKILISNLTDEIKALSDSEADAGTF